MELKTILKDVELFNGLNETDLEQVAAIFIERQLDRGELVAEQGSPGDSLFLVTEGFVEIARVGKKGSVDPEVLVNLGEGQIFGEMSLVDQGPRSASVRAISDPTTVQVVTRADFEALCQKNTHIGYVVMRNIAADLSFKLRQRHMSG
jgi:CRP-like cAMP-binding protein